MNVGDRIKKVRRELDLTQTEFAAQLGLTQNTITRYETGDRKPSAAVLSLIVKEFNVNENWLRTGEGEIFRQREKDVIDQLCDELHASELDAEIIRAYFRIDPRIREPFMRRLIQEVRTSSTAPAPGTSKDIHASAAGVDTETETSTPDTSEKQQADYEAEARAEAELFYQQRLSEKKQESQVSSAKESGAS